MFVDGCGSGSPTIPRSIASSGEAGEFALEVFDVDTQKRLSLSSLSIMFVICCENKLRAERSRGLFRFSETSCDTRKHTLLVFLVGGEICV